MDPDVPTYGPEIWVGFAMIVLMILAARGAAAFAVDEKFPKLRGVALVKFIGLFLLALVALHKLTGKW